MKSWLYKSDTEIYSTHNEEKSVAVEFVRTSKNKLQIHDFNIKKYVLINYMI